MIRRRPSKLATRLLKLFGPKDDGLVGDLREAYAAGKSRTWYWGQVLTVIAMNAGKPGPHRAICCSVVATATFGVVLILPFFPWVGSGDWDKPLVMILLLVPSALPIAAPVGVTVGTFCGLGNAAARYRRTPVVAIAVTLCVASFVNEAWIVPASNQAYRAVFAGREVLRGANELSLLELRPLVVDNAIPAMNLVAPNDHWQLALSYYGRIAVAFAPLAFAMFMLAAGAVDARKRIALALCVGCAYVGYFLLAPEILRLLPAIIAAWLPNAAVASLSLLIGWRSLGSVALL